MRAPFCLVHLGLPSLLLPACPVPHGKDTAHPEETAADVDTSGDTGTGGDTGLPPACDPRTFAVRVSGFEEWRFDEALGPPVVTDLDGDTHPDLVLLQGEGLRILWGGGDLSFADPLLVPLGQPFVDLAVVEPGGDGLPEVILLAEDGEVLVVPQTAARTLGAPASWWTAGCETPAFDLVFADLDDDGSADAFVSCTGGTYAIRSSSGDPSGTSATSPDPYDTVLPADWDGDGDEDLLLGGLDGRDLTLVLGDAGGTYSTSRVPVSEEVRLLAAGDLDGDGDPDVAAATGHENDLTWVENLGAAGFQVHSLFVDDYGDPYYRVPDHLFAADVDGDGISDLLADADLATWTWSGNPGGPQDTKTANDWIQALDAVAFSDLDGDGTVDAVVSDAGGWLTVRRGAGDGSFQTPAALTLEQESTPLGSRAVDLDGDGDLDLAVATEAQAAFYLLDAETGTFAISDTWQDTGVDEVDLGVFQVGDLDGDGDPDLVAANTGRADEIFVFLLDGAGHVAEVRVQTLTDATRSGRQMVLEDLDGDGDLDLVLDLHGNPTLRTLLNDGTGTFTLSATLELDRVVVDLAAGHFNGDGLLDLAFYDEEDTEISLLLGDGTGSFTVGAPIPRGERTYDFAAGDFDGDGLDDLWTLPESYGLVLLLNDGDGASFTATPVLPDLRPTGEGEATAADLDADGILDLVVYDNQGTDTWHLLGGDGTGAFVDRGEFSLPTHSGRMTAGDFDGDGHVDLANRMPTTEDSSLGVYYGPCGEGR